MIILMYTMYNKICDVLCQKDTQVIHTNIVIDIILSQNKYAFKKKIGRYGMFHF